MFYKQVLDTSADPQRTASGLLRLRAALRKQVPAKVVGEQILLATWNLREFGGNKGGGRTPESIAYIAEILGHFDLIAIQEIRKNREALKQVLAALGSWWKVLYTDLNEGRAGMERLAFLYDSRVVVFDGLAGEVVLPESRNAPVRQLARTPFTCGFRAGWKRLELTTVHVYYGKEVRNEPRRVAEIGEIAKLLAKRGVGMSRYADAHTIALGDFNIFDRKDVTFEQLTKAGFEVPETLQAIPGTNVAKTKRHYDQIAILKRDRGIEVTRAGVFDFFEHVYRHDVKNEVSDAQLYAVPAGDFREWRTYQMSDHLPMWAALKVDESDSYLNSRAQQVAPPSDGPATVPSTRRTRGRT